MNRKLSAFLTGFAAIAVAGGLFSAASCSKNNDDELPIDLSSDTLKGSITKNITLTSGNTYYLSGATFIKSGFTLTIQPGVVIKAIKGTKAVLVITRGAKIDAQGTVAQPIVFTSNQAAGSRASGDWGGVVLLGKAIVNTSTTVDGAGTRIVEGFDAAEASAYGADIIGGGKTTPDNADNTGIMKYVRIEFPGIALSSTTNSELNGLTLVAVGSTTVLDNIQVSYSGDDSFEFFGGTVNATHLVAYRTLDDDFDTDNGFSGKLQFAFSVRDNAIHDVDAGSSNGFESDNEDPVPATLHEPVTAPVFSNFTLIGPGAFTGTLDAAFGRAALIRRGSRLSVFNSVFTGWANGLNISDDFSNASATGGALEIKNNFLVGFAAGKFIYSTYAAGQTGTVNVGANILAASGNANDVSVLTAAGLNLTNLVLGTAAMDLRPSATSPLLGKASFTSTKLAGVTGITPVTYVGAFASAGDTWATGWTNYDPKNASYAD